MPDVFWIARGEIKGPGPGGSESLRPGGVQPGWIEVMHRIGEPAPDTFIGSAPLVYNWPSLPWISAYLIQDTCRAIIVGEHALISLIESTPNGIDQTILASPQAVGLHNLFPRAHLPFWWALPASKLAQTSQRMEKAGFDPAQVGWLAGDPSSVSELSGQFPNSNPLPAPGAGMVAQLNLLVQQLIETHSTFGLLAGKTPSGSLLFTLVEL